MDQQQIMARLLLPGKTMAMTDAKQRIQIYDAARQILQRIKNENPMSRDADLMLKVLDMLRANNAKSPRVIPFVGATKPKEAGVIRKIRSAG
jgi:hypothetical protein